MYLRSSWDGFLVIDNKKLSITKSNATDVGGVRFSIGRNSFYFAGAFQQEEALGDTVKRVYKFE